MDGTALAWRWRRSVVRALARIDAGVDLVVYRPAVVRAFLWMPRWWRCDLARASVRLDQRWGTGWWDDGPVPGPWCDACGRRAAWIVYGGEADEDGGDDTGIDDHLAHHPVSVCGWCRLDGPLRSESELRRALADARVASVAWRWRPPR